MAGKIDASLLAQSLVGTTVRTIAQGKPNEVLAVDSANVYVGTEESPTGSEVALTQLQRALNLLVLNGEVRIEPETFGGYRRSSFIGAALATLPGTITTSQPTWVRLTSNAPFQTGLTDACRLMSAPRVSSTLTAADSLYGLVVDRIPALVREASPTTAGYKIKGSVGQAPFRWAETPWVAVMDRLVTETAQKGYYIVYLFASDGKGVYLSLNQGGAAVGRLSALKQLATTHRQRIAEQVAVTKFVGGPLDLNASGMRTKWYEAGDIASVYYPFNAIPHDAVLIADLRIALSLYARLVEAWDAIEPPASTDIPSEIKSGIEQRHYRWHLRAEGRNRSLARKAKQLHGYECAVCRHNFKTELGELGKGYLEAHHLTPFGELDERPRQLDPSKDFAIVCANCHRLLHSRTPPLQPEEGRALLESLNFPGLA